MEVVLVSCTVDMTICFVMLFPGKIVFSIYFVFILLRTRPSGSPSRQLHGSCFCIGSTRIGFVGSMSLNRWSVQLLFVPLILALPGLLWFPLCYFFPFTSFPFLPYSWHESHVFFEYKMMHIF